MSARLRIAVVAYCWLGVLGVLGCVRTPAGAEPRQSPVLESAESWFARARALAARGDSSRAEQYALLAVRAGWPEERAIGLLLHVCVEAMRLRAARLHAEAFLASHPAAFGVRYVLAAIDLALDDERAAMRELTRVLAEQPTATDARRLLDVVAREHAAHAADDDAESRSR